MGTQISFNAEEVELDNGKGLLPPGWYQVELASNHNWIASSTGSQCLRIDCTILGGPHAGGTIEIKPLMFWNPPGDVSKKIADEILAKICHAVGVSGIRQDLDELMGKRCEVKIGHRGDNHTFWQWRPMQSMTAQNTSPPAAQTSPAWANNPGN